MQSSFDITIWRRKSGPRRRVRQTPRRVTQIEPLEPRLLLANYTWERKNDGSPQTGWTTTNTGDWIQANYAYPDSNQWTAPRHVSESVWTAPGPAKGQPSTGVLVVDQPGNWNRSDYPDATDADVVIGKGADVRLSGSVNFPYAGSPRLSGSVAIRSLDNSGSLETYQAQGAGEGILNVHGTSIKNGGTITLTGGANAGGSLGIHAAGTTAITGSGKIVLQDGEIFRPAAGQGGISQAATHSITGKGLVNAPITSNAGTISADSGGTLAVDLKGVTLTNTGLLQAASGGTISGSTLAIGGGTIVNTGGTIRAQGDSSRVSLTNVTLVGGTLASSGTGVIQVGASTTFNGATSAIANAATLSVGGPAGGSLTWKGGIDNRGVISVQDPSYPYDAMLVVEAGASLRGGGSIRLANGSLRIAGSGVLANLDNSVSGAGSIKGDAAATLSLGAAAVIVADGNSLFVDVPVTGAGTLRAINGGSLSLPKSVTVTGTITAGDKSSVSIRSGSTLGGVTLAREGTGGFSLGTATLDGSARPLENRVALKLNSKSTLSLKGAIRNTGSIETVRSEYGYGTDYDSKITLAADTILSGGGTVVVTGQYEGTLGGVGTLTNSDNTIKGSGTLGQGLTALTNVGTIEGRFTFPAPTTNSGRITGTSLGFTKRLVNTATLSTDSLTADDGITNAAGASLSIVGTEWSRATIVSGTFANAGLLATSKSAPAFWTLSHAATGVQTAAAGDVIQVSGDFLNTSTQATRWNTGAAALRFIGAREHVFQLAGRNLGTAATAWTGNFAWGQLGIDSGASVSLSSGRSDGVAAAGYVGTLAGARIAGDPAVGAQSITNIKGNGLNLYYDPAASANAYLAGRAYTLQAGGMLLPKAAPAGARAPTAPTGLAGTPATTQVALAWTAPTTTGGAPIIDYVVQYSGNAGTTWSTFADGVSTATKATVTGLASGARYSFRVAAVNYAGATASAPVTLATVLGAPTDLVATPGNGWASLTWSGPGGEGGAEAITDYVVQSSGDNGQTWSTVSDGKSPATRCTVTGLINGKAYRFRVAAVNAGGTGALSAPSAAVAPANLPTGLFANPGDGRATVYWTAPATGGTSITDYRLQMSADGGKTWSAVSRPASTTTRAVVSGLPNGKEHLFRVAAVRGATVDAYGPATPVTPLAASPAADFTYTTASGVVTITRYRGPGGAVSVPATIGGLPVRAIAANTFGWPAKAVTSLVIPEGVETIGNDAVTGQTDLVSLSLPSTLKSLGSIEDGGFRAFVSRMRGVAVPAALVSIDWSRFAGASGNVWVDPANPAFASVDGIVYDKALKTVLYCPSGRLGPVTLPASVTAIGPRAFDGCSGISNVMLPAGLTSIGRLAFAGTDIRRIQIPAAVTMIADLAFKNCPSLSEIAVAAGNTAYASTAGVLYDKSLRTLVRAPSSGVTGTFTVPATVTRIAAGGFDGCRWLTGVTLPLGLMAIGDGGFEGCLGVKSLALPASVTTIGSRALAAGLTSIVFPSSVVRLGEAVLGSFADDLTSIVFQGDAPTIDGDLFDFPSDGPPAVSYRSTTMGWTDEFGGQATSAVSMPLAVAPAAPKATAGAGRVTLAWSAPAGAAAITNYIVQYRATTAPAADWTTFVRPASAATTATVTGLANGVGYVFRVAAVTAGGTGTFSSPSVVATPRA